MYLIRKILTLANNFNLCTFAVFLNHWISFFIVHFNQRIRDKTDIQQFQNTLCNKTNIECEKVYYPVLRILAIGPTTTNLPAKSQFLLPSPRILKRNYVLVDTVRLRQTQQPAYQSEIQTPRELLSMYSCTNSSSNTYSTFFYIAVVISSCIYYISISDRSFTSVPQTIIP